MAIVKMKHLQVLALERDHDAILRRLQHMAVWRSASRIYRRFPTPCAGAILRQRTCWPANGSCNRP